MTEAFDGWFDSNFLDPDGGASHLPDWFRGDMQKAWDAGRAAQAPTVGVLHDIYITMRHARTFITSREKMHPTGIELWDRLFAQIEALQASPLPSAHQSPPPEPASQNNAERLPSSDAATGGGETTSSARFGTPNATTVAALREADPTPRCEVCDWPLADSMEKGCIPGNCSYRPDDPAEQERIRRRRAALTSTHQNTTSE